MKRTPILGLAAAFGFMFAASYIVMPVLYSRLPEPVSFTMWAMTVVCAVLAWRVKRAGEHGIGLDNSQLNPITVANFMLVGRASAWTGALVGGASGGIVMYAGLQSGALSSVLGGVAMAIAGVVLERACEVPPVH
ncbi:DUF3180 domain-containing protein [Corynebacterium lizhenjunii]|uniref:DUF3180 domain-containing protein n=1 Tax=Corynebacterium lizhenjunii TaxID=2709394 RepID=A0A7T0KGT6_9CORY|nr:DUF3180 domain-containing protein [Corynebacterium lizhenjunii]QPK79503.1 DUF3180 domain-containing protein [Corynebacterium lizhenjunii]